MADLLDPDRHPNGDLFVLEDLPCVVPKSDMPSMPHPYFALRVGDQNVRHYENNGVEITVEPSIHGLATINDKDIWLFAISHLVRALERNDPEASSYIRFSASDFLRFCNRATGGHNYKKLRAGLNRLMGTRILTNQETGGKRTTNNFGLLVDGTTVEGDVVGRGREMMIEVQLPPWLCRSVEQFDVLTINENYFRLRRPIDRRLYEIARKHCGSQKEWFVGLDTLSIKIGAGYEIRRLRYELQKAVDADIIPDYRIFLDRKTDTVRFENRNYRTPTQKKGGAGESKGHNGRILGFDRAYLEAQAHPGEPDLKTVAERLKRSRSLTRKTSPDEPGASTEPASDSENQPISESRRDELKQLRQQLTSS
ncbi:MULTISPECIES: replication initiator protein A [unclassified Thioalkalivibrio]|uniref:replication initiator protein A n=1 Tax=unclassified Thioalkalivibrio TaxID=2621013 RepID=UPI0003660FF0|nr:MULTISPECIES: replication initiator protein A [unclassified Thioalkalivibrio]